ncbi:MAG: fused MFS/spermidine synthase [Eubacterium sp.]|nr:fused MFS/spermidine synthase [Eubacterium sp.]
MEENINKRREATAADRPILKNKIYLYMTEFFAGMSVMAVELGASRLLAPYFSSSQIVWTIIIGTIMIAMALGNIYGGRKVDKNPNPDRLYGRIIFAAIWIALIPVVGKYIILGISGLLVFTISTNFLVIAAFAACMVIFVFPLFLLGTVTPSLVKYTVDSLDDSGKVVGMLNASNTIGSIIGTFVPTFISIPAVGTSVTFLIFAGILLLLAIIYFAKSHVFVKKVPAAIILFILCCIFGHSGSFAFWQKHLAVEDESIYNYLQVKETEQEVVLSTNVLFGVQSVYRKEKELTGMYYDYAMAAPYMADIYEKERPLDVLILGMGTGTYATQCRRFFGEMNIEGVEIDQKITDLARTMFALPEDVPVATYDGRAYLNALSSGHWKKDSEFGTEDGMYDVIMVDAYQDITIPFQMSTVEFFTMVKEHLRSDGVMVVNMNMRGIDTENREEAKITDYLADTIASVFPEVVTVDVRNTTNRELFAGEAGFLTRFRNNVGKEKDQELSAMMGQVEKGFVTYTGGDHIMTDDRAPVELLGMQVIDEMIREEVRYYKRIYDEEGLDGLLNAL